MVDIRSEPWPPHSDKPIGIRAVHEPSKLSVICLTYGQASRNREEAERRLRTILKHRQLD